jgi:hypothetical protein
MQASRMLDALSEGCLGSVVGETYFWAAQVELVVGTVADEVAV